MIRPVDMQLSYWKVEQQASNSKAPDSSFAQTMQSQEMVEEAQWRENRVLESEESQTEDRIKEKKEGHSRHSGKGESEEDEAPRKEEETSPEASGKKTSLGGLDLYG